MGEPEHLQDVLASNPLLLTPEEAATVLRIGRTTIYALMKAGDLRPVHIGRSCRLPRAELERYVRCLESPSDIAPTPTGHFLRARSPRSRIDATPRGMSSQ
jgi:excisionase family DNA binding protein